MLDYGGGAPALPPRRRPTRSEAGRIRWSRYSPEQQAAIIARLRGAVRGGPRGPMSPERRYAMKIAGKARWYNLPAEEKERARSRLEMGMMAYRGGLARRGLLGKGSDIAYQALLRAATDHGFTVYRVGKRVRLDFPYHGLFIDVGATNIHLQTAAGALRTKGEMRAIRRGAYSLY